MKHKAPKDIKKLPNVRREFRWKKTAVMAAIVFLVTFLLHYIQLLETPDRFLTDSLYQRLGTKDNRIKIIAIDEKTLDALGPLSTWSRSVAGELLGLLNASPKEAPAVIVFDIMFIGETDETADALLTAACENSVSVVAASNVVYETVLYQGDQGKLVEDKLHVKMIEYPYEALNAHVTAGFANVAADRDGYIRNASVYVEYGGESIPSLSMAAYTAYMEQAHQEVAVPKTDVNNRFSFAYTGKPGTYENFSLIDVLEGRIPASYFKDSILFIGAYAPGMQDSFNTPIDRSRQMYGVEAHANIVQALLEQKTVRNAPLIPAALIIAALAAFYYFLLQKVLLPAGGICLAVLTAGEFVSGKLLFDSGWYVGLLTLPVSLVGVYAWQIIRHYLLERKRRQEIFDAFQKYVSPQVVEEISKSGEFSFVLGGEKRDIAVLFVDIRGFTSMSESLMPEQVVGILNEYLGLITTSIFENSGTLDKFIGDAAMAVFNAPFDLGDYIYKAVKTASDIMEGAGELENKLREKYGRSVSFGIGIHCGEAVVGNIGCDFRMDYTAIGDTVNTAARLESNAKPGQILISEEVYKRVGERAEAAPVGFIPLKGKSKEVMVYSLEKLYESAGS